jgi:hypothetical protein
VADAASVYSVLAQSAETADSEGVACVVTTIQAPTIAVRELAHQCASTKSRLIVVGDRKSPFGFALPDCDYYSLTRQHETGFRTASAAPENNYCRKNLGYLLAIAAGYDVIRETDDDNRPGGGFFTIPNRWVSAPHIISGQWVNVYSYFASQPAETGPQWPRGFPLTEVRTPAPPYESLTVRDVECPIQQGLVAGEPDVDAISRLLFGPRTLSFSGRSVALGEGSWCPFNSQNTTWWRDAFPLLYLPAYCSFRTTDILRGFVALRIAWAQGWSLLFHESPVFQDRNKHDLLSDFEQEIPIYLGSSHIAGELERLDIPSGVSQIPDALRLCYEALLRAGVVVPEELRALEAWLGDLADIDTQQNLYA